MAEKVTYEMNLQDLVSSKLDNAEKHAQKFESTLGRVKESLVGFGEKIASIGETLGISFAFIKLEEFFHEGTELVHTQDVAIGQLENTIRNVGERAGLTSEELVEMAQKMQHEIPFTTAKIVDMENALSRFGNMTPAVYQKVLTASADIATALKRDGTDVANTLGRIMEAPAENGRLLRQLNITLTAEQRKYLMQLEQTGQIAKAQTFIFEELATKGYGGAAKAAANSDPLFRYNKAMYELEMRIGAVGIRIEEAFAPALEKLADVFTSVVTAAQNVWHWIQRNKEVLEDLLIVNYSIGAAYILYIGYTKAAEFATIAYNVALSAISTATELYTAFTMALAEGESVLTAAQWALNVAMDANPVGILIVGIGALIGGLIVAYKHSETFRAILQGIGYVAKDLWSIFKGLWEVEIGVFTFNPSRIKEGFASVAQAGKDIGSAFQRGYAESIRQSMFDDDLAADEKKHHSTMGDLQNKGGVKKPAMGAMIGGKASQSTKVTGSKTTTFNIRIDKLAEITLKTTNLHDAAGKIRDVVTQTLLAAVNDSQIVSGE